MQTNMYATERAKKRNELFPGETGAKRLAKELGCGHVSIYEWERDGRDHLPKNRHVRAAYLKALGLDLTGVDAEHAPILPGGEA